MKTKTMCLLAVIFVVFFMLTTTVTANVMNNHDGTEKLDDVINNLGYANSHIGMPEFQEVNSVLSNQTVRMYSPMVRGDENYLNKSTSFIFNDVAKEYLSSLHTTTGFVTGYGVDYTGYVVIQLSSNITSYTENDLIEIQNSIQNIATEIGLNPIPIRFKELGELKIDSPQVSRTITESRATPSDRWRPIIGGIGISIFENEQDQYGDKGTIGFSATRNGVTGFVTHGHSMGIGYEIYQPPEPATTTDKVGTVQAIGRTYSDSSWVPYSNCQAAIYSESMSNQKRPVIGYNDGGSGVVSMAGLMTRSSGYITDYRSQIDDHPEFGTLYSQYLASYSNQYGDSGAPIYQSDRDTHNVILVGVNVGYYSGGSSMFSPMSGVIRDLGITPMVS